MHCTRRVASSASAVLLLGCAALAGDYIQRKDGSFSPVFKGGDRPQSPADFDASDWQIIDADMTNVTYTIPVGGKAQVQKMPSAEVMELWPELKDYPQPHWKESSTLLQSGEWAKAAEKYRAIGDEKKVHPVVRQQALLRAARAAGAGGDKGLPQADAAYDYLLKTFPTSFYTRHVWKDRWILFIDAGKEDKAQEAIDQLLKLAGVTEGDKLEARFASTTIKMRKAVAAKDTGAIQKFHDEYKALAGETSGKADLASVHALARIGMGTCLIELGNPKEAKGIFDEMCQREGFENSVNAAAFNGLGECWYKQNDTKGFTEALRCVLRTQLLYADGASSDAVAKAIYYTGDCFARLGDHARAKVELSSCMSRFPNSPWATAANRLRQNLPK